MKGRSKMKEVQDENVWSDLPMSTWQWCSLTVDDEHCSLSLVQHLHHFRVARDTPTGRERLVHLQELLTM